MFNYSFSPLGWPTRPASPAVTAYVACPLQQCTADQNMPRALEDMKDFYNYESAGSDGDIETDYAISSSHPRLIHRQRSTNTAHHIHSESSSLSSVGLDSGHMQDPNVCCSKLSDSDDRQTVMCYGRAGNHWLAV